MNRILRRDRARGAVLIEALITATIVAIGVLGLAQLQGRTAIVQIEAQQRTQALLIARDMAERLVANRPNAAAYIGSDYGLATGSCDTSSTVARDRCAWNAALQGANERIGTILAGGLRNGRGCVMQAAPRRYRVAVVWQGVVSTAAPAIDCWRDAFGVETLRRAVVVPVELPDLAAA